MGYADVRARSQRKHLKWIVEAFNMKAAIADLFFKVAGTRAVILF